MAKRTSKTTDENKEQLKAIVDELKANRVQSSDESVKLQTVLESLAEQTKKLVASIDKLSVRPKKDVQGGFEGSGVSPVKGDKTKVEKTEKKQGFGEATGKFVKDNKGLLSMGAAAAFLLNPKLALSVLEKMVSVGSNLASVIENIANADIGGIISSVAKSFADNPIIMTGLAALGAYKGAKIAKGLWGVGKAAVGGVGKAIDAVKGAPATAKKVMDVVSSVPGRVASTGKTVASSVGGAINTVKDVAKTVAPKVISTLGAAANTVKDVTGTGIAKVAAATPMATSTAGGVLNTIKGVASTGLAKVASVIPPSIVSGAGAAANTVKDVGATGLSKAASAMPTGVTSVIKGAGEVAGGLISKITSTLAPLATLPGVKTFLKAIPGLGLLLSVGSAAMRVADGDYIGAAIELASGVAGLFPGIGTAAALGLQGVNFARDKAAEKAESRMDRGANPVDRNKLIPDNRPDSGKQEIIPGGSSVGGGSPGKPGGGSPGEPAKVLNSDAPKGLEAGAKKLKNAHLSIDYGDSVKTGGSKAWRNNNPGNIRYGDYAKSQGAIGKDKDGFAVFADEQAGDKAREKLLFEGKNYKDLSVSAAITRYAPPSENNTGAYIADVSKAMGVDPNTKMSDLSPEQRQKMMAAMKKKEGYEAGVVTAKEGGSKISPEMAKAGTPAGAPVGGDTKTAPAPATGDTKVASAPAGASGDTKVASTPAATKTAAAAPVGGDTKTPLKVGDKGYGAQMYAESRKPKTSAGGVFNGQTVVTDPKVAAPDKPKTETAALQTDLNKTKSESNNKPTIVVAGGGGGGGGSSSSNVTNNNVTNVNRPDYLSKDLTAPFSFAI